RSNGPFLATYDKLMLCVMIYNQLDGISKLPLSESSLFELPLYELPLLESPLVEPHIRISKKINTLEQSEQFE
ncbi:16653_t:CDS:1, partial [Gigaspora margarita]